VPPTRQESVGLSDASAGGVLRQENTTVIAGRGVKDYYYLNYSFHRRLERIKNKDSSEKVKEVLGEPDYHIDTHRHQFNDPYKFAYAYKAPIFTGLFSLFGGRYFTAAEVWFDDENRFLDIRFTQQDTSGFHR
jgi:hypothetical protein